MEIINTLEPEMTAEEFLLIRDFIHEKCGIFFAENKMYLVKNRLIKRMVELGIKSYRDYFYHVKYDTSLKEFNKLMSLITTNETSFFRNEPQLKSFSDELIPKLIDDKIKNNSPKSIKIWSAGCSTGEEPYTLGIILQETLKAHPEFKVEIIANDISEDVLQKARRGEYSGITLRNMSPDLLNRYFIKNNESYRIKPEVKNLVNFSHLNLNDPRRIKLNNNFDVIFCRNVMIYFSDEVKKQLVRCFYNALLPGGYFYIGHSETLHGISKAFKLVYFKNALVYNKEGVGMEKDSSASALKRTSLLFNQDKNKATELSSDASGGAARALDLLSKIKK